MKKLILKHALKNAVEHEGKAVPDAVIKKVLGEDKKLLKKMKELSLELNKIVKKVNEMSFEEQEKKLLKIWPSALKKKIEEKKELPDLPNITEKVVMRLAPYPSGPLHIGNARPYIINDEYVKKYNGKLLLVIDDTIGTEKKAIIPEAYELIPEGLKWLGIDFDPKIVYKSDRLEIYYEYAEKLIKTGHVYVCKCSQKQLKENRAKGIECPCRKQYSEETLAEWKKMLAEEYREGEAILRLRTSMTHPNPAFRDRVLFRISERKHPRIGKKYSVWPLLEFSWAIDDCLLGITHVLRGKELMMESEMEKFIWHVLGMKAPVLLHTGLFRIKGVKLSKSKAQEEVLKGVYSGWDDPRTWSLQALRRRGITPEAVRKFLLSIGMSQADVTLPVDILYAENRKIIDKNSNRYFFVPNPVKIRVDKIPKTRIKACLYPHKPERGVREYEVEGKIDFYIPKQDAEKLKKGDLFRLKDAFAVKVTKKNKELLGEFLETKSLEMPKIQWTTEENIPVEIIMDDGSVIKGIGEKYLEKTKINDHLQLERFGYVRIDEKRKEKIICYFTHK